ncbi:MAG: DUF4173 domain-containing protein [Lachnospiraceae bacterium]
MNEKPLVTRMRENYKYFGGMSLIYGLIFTFCLYNNLSGITFPICVIVTIMFAILFMKKIEFRLQKYSFLYILGMCLLGISTALTSSFFLHFFNILGIILLFFVFMIHQFYNDMNWNFPAYLKRIFILFGTIIECIPYPYWHGSKYINRNKDNKNHNTLIAIVIGFLLSLLILSVTLPLLLKSDLMFAKIFGEILKHINFSTIFGVSFMGILGFTLCYAFFSALCKYNFPEGRPRKLKYYNPVIGITFTSVVSFVYFVYCMIQIMYLFIGIHAGLPENVTYAQYARGGFWELLFVSFINFVMVLICMYVFSENLVLKIVLTFVSGCTFIMILSAAYRIILYIGVYHLTLLRILVLWFLAVLTFIIGGVIVSIYRKRFPLFQYIVAVVSVFYIFLSFLRPDAVVAKYNIAHMDEVSCEDVLYLLYNTSCDAAPEIAKLNEKIDMEDIKNENEFFEQQIINYFINISEENEGIYFRKANYSRIRAKLAADRWLEENSYTQMSR